ncbi:MAG: hypothetical protein KAQ98_10475 [Bacteriovoracaceae bacterium]|nr:hypothetical protein [Bacteriovoracaceae bacterium]
MKKLMLIVMSLTFILSSAFAAQFDKNAARNELSSIYNSVSTMNSSEYIKMLVTLEEAALENGMIDEAAVFATLQKNPESRSDILAMVKDKIEDTSENGIFLLIYLSYPAGWCYYTDYRCGFGVAFLSILTLTGEPAVRY